MITTLRGPLTALCAALLLVACGGGGGGGGGNSGGGSTSSVPGAPTNIVVAAGNGTATVSFTAPLSNGSSAILDYTATCAASGASRTATGTGSPLTVTGLTNGVSYNCTVTARNAVGSGAASSGASVTPTAPTTSCSATDRKNWVVQQLREWYLYPETLPATVNVDDYATVDALISFMTATARAQGKDRNFTYITSIAEENAFFNSGATAGFGIRLFSDTAARRVFITEAFENAPALTAGIDRRDELLGVGTTTANIRSVSDIIATEGASGVTNALGPNTSGTTRVLRVSGPSGTRDLTIAKADYSIEPVSPRYGGVILQDGTKKVGYINLRTFISSANARLREEFLKLRNAGVTEVIVDFRYNGGGLVSTGELMGDLLGGNRSSGQIFSQLTFRPEKSVENSIKYFAAQPEAVSPTKLAFIGTRSTASASELVINGFIPYFNANLALIGDNTFGKPVGQIARDRATCDDRLRVLAFTTRNSANSDAYFNGLAEAVKASCRAADDVTQPLGNASEASIRQAIDYLAGKSCTAISVSSGVAALTGRKQAASAVLPDTDALDLEPLVPDQPTVVQREMPGLF
jgi:C-terminal processing protease CtpA/Prc